MQESRNEYYAQSLSRLIRAETISSKDQGDKSKFYAFHDLLRQMFPTLFSVASYEDVNGSFLLHWKGQSDREPILFMNHHDVVEASTE